jgi:Zn-dependent M28 family amino/carboxypeptidase
LLDENDVNGFLGAGHLFNQLLYFRFTVIDVLNFDNISKAREESFNGVGDFVFHDAFPC